MDTPAPGVCCAVSPWRSTGRVTQSLAQGRAVPLEAQTTSAARHRACSVGSSLAPRGPGLACHPLGVPAAPAPPPQQMHDRQQSHPGP